MPIHEYLPYLAIAWTAYFIAVVSPGPATLALAAILTAYAGILTVLKIVGGLYLLWLAWKSFRSAMTPNALHLAALANTELTRRQLYFKGLMLHLTNPKAILAWLSMLSLGLPPGAPTSVIAFFIAGCLLIGCTSFVGLAILFSTGPVRRGYTHARRHIDAFVGVFFAAAGLKLLTARI